MDASDKIALAALMVSVLVAGGSVIGFLINRSAAKHADEKAERATAAAERSAVAQERMARVSELQMMSTASIEQTAAWQLTHFQGDAYMLENLGGGPAYDVTVGPVHPSLNVISPNGEPDRMDPGDQLKLHVFQSMATSDDRILVTWQDSPWDGKRREWKRSLPPSR